MKKHIILVAALFASLFAFAQKGQIIYTDFEPDIFRDYWKILNVPMPDINLDLDQNGTDDIKLYKEYSGWGFQVDAIMTVQSTGWWYRLPYTLFAPDNANPITGDTIHVDDVIANIENCWLSWAYRFSTYGGNTACTIGDPNGHYYVSVKHQTTDGWCYGWIDMNMYVNIEEGGSYHFYVTVYRMAYCDVPNYPLRVGQTDFSDEVLAESNDQGFVSVFPNPTNGQITITGKELKSAEVYNTLGQHIATTHGEGNQLIVDLCGQPAGVYFVNVTDKEGRKCVRKVVKQ